MNEIMDKLKAPFKPDEIEWRVQSCGLSNNKPWAKVLAYVQARAIQIRLDDVFGWNGWQDEYKTMGDNVICRLSVFDGEKWIYKENGASNTDIEAFKGGISGAFKRVAASGYGIGRYLYDLEETFAECQLEKPSDTRGWTTAKAKEKDSNKFTTIYWKVPNLPSWALPENKISEVQAKSIKTRLEKLNQLDYVLNFYKLEKVEDMTVETLSKINDWCSRKETKAAGQ